ncbi:Nif3-like dinuclear metal center hexameric protein [Clostridium sp.]|uniref:Nif3-like dinuclear metal center hexameric protein n=1 Tax=Clostridium sp. TaxID=1506 RepID=UPI002FC936D1
MKAVDLYNSLEKDFIFPELSDDWARYMGEVEDYLTPSFKKRSMGLVCDFATEINEVYSAVFPTDEVINRIIEEGVTDSMLFLHHPSIWDIRKPIPFQQMNSALLEKLKENRISIYNLHVPLDNFSEYSTSKTLADALDIEIEKPFGVYRGGLCGVIGKTKCKNMIELQQKFTRVLGHDTKLYLYGENDITDGKVAIVAGGGNNNDTISEMLENKVNVLISGITVKNPHSSDTHKMEEENSINVLGGTHYSTEKFACKRICDYFEELGIPATFIDGEPIYEDM